MAVITEEEKGVLKGKVSGLDLFSAQQVLVGLICIIEKRASIKSVELIEALDEAFKLTGFHKVVGDN